MTLKHDERLAGVKLPLVRVIKLAASRLSFDLLVSEGLRSKEQMMVNYGKGRTAAECQAKGIPAKYAQPRLAKVTWLNHPLESKHGAGEAVDVYPLVKGALATTQHDLPLFRAMYEAVMGAAAELQIHVRYGADWNGNGKLFEKGETDAVHWELK